MRFVAVLLMALALSAHGESKIVCTVQTEEPKTLHPLLAGWNTGDFGNSLGTYYKDVNGVVHLQGMIWKFTGGVAGEQPTSYSDFIKVLPEGYRPRQNEWFKVNASDGGATVIVFATGEVQVIETFGYFTWVSLSGVSFRAQ